uniref:Uncharacterized protein n=1 Tax=Medicago truncatula TaxID=3880 RepID=A2Q2B2_MEDTR|nr:hypothetical protein MtrDRAFT_AC149642g29v2 [Medicago truncatula]
MFLTEIHKLKPPSNMGKKKVGDLCQPTQFHASSSTPMVILRVRLKNSSGMLMWDKAGN